MILCRFVGEYQHFRGISYLHFLVDASVLGYLDGLQGRWTVRLMGRERKWIQFLFLLPISDRKVGCIFAVDFCVPCVGC